MSYFYSFNLSLLEMSYDIFLVVAVWIHEYKFVWWKCLNDQVVLVPFLNRPHSLTNVSQRNGAKYEVLPRGPFHPSSHIFFNSSEFHAGYIVYRGGVRIEW